MERTLLLINLSLALCSALPAENLTAEGITTDQDSSFVERRGKTFRIIGDIINSILQPGGSGGSGGYRGGCRTIWETGYRTEYQERCSSSFRTECSTKYQDQCSTDYETKYQTKCSQSTSRECSTSLETKLEEECSISYKEVCSGRKNFQNIRKIVESVDLKIIGDTNNGKRCELVSEEICKKVPVSKPVTNCVEVPQQECEEVPVKRLVEKCQKVPVEDCREVPVRNCRKVPVRKQTKKARRVCS